ncbi:MAG: carboxypeptidase-like regulatory domain-containing protein [Gemmatimonadetes bacterium]|nr:carboxypeptidase-like regulatory domain-containing protein [Gemmatimonadota bacterium]
MSGVWSAVAENARAFTAKARAFGAVSERLSFLLSHLSGVRPRTAVFVVALFFLALSTERAAGQTIRGWVLRADRTPIAGAAVLLRVEDGVLLARTTTGDDGRFELDAVAGEGLVLHAEHLGFAAWETAPFDLAADADLDVLIQMQFAPIPLDELRVQARRQQNTRRLADFERRKELRAFGGYFLEEGDIARRAASRPSNLVLEAPGMTVRPVPGPFDRWIVMSGDCPATVYVDGVRINQMNASVDEYLELPRIAGVEVYPRAMSAPPQFMHGPGPECGTVLYWTKDLEPDDSGGWTTTKIVLGSLGFAALIVLGLAW